MVRPLEDVFEEADRYFMGESPVHKAASRVARALSELDLPFVVVGAMAVNAHGHHRTTADVDLLLNREDLETFKAEYLGRGWVEVFKGSKSMRDAVHDVKIDVLLSGEFPGDGREKPVRFPRPEDVERVDTGKGFAVPALPVVMELKLASGMTAPHRPRDLDDVIQLIRLNALALDYGDKLDPYVREKFAELWSLAQVEEDF